MNKLLSPAALVIQAGFAVGALLAASVHLLF